jgi:hypothetical protein
MAGMYPGSNYVDWTGMDGYNWGTDRNNAWQTFAQVFGGSAYNGWFNTYQLLQQTAPDKPVMIGETASSEDGGNKAAWITDMLSTQLPTNFPNIKAFLWFNWAENDPVLDWPIESSAASSTAFSAGIASPYYAANDFADLSTSPIPALKPTALTSTLLAVADTDTDASNPNSVLDGTAVSIRSDGDPAQIAFMKFDLATLAGRSLTSVRLRIRTTGESFAGSGGVQNVRLVPDSAWQERYLSHNNRVPTSSLLGTFTAPVSNTWYEATLSIAQLQPYAGRLVSIAVDTTSGDGLVFSARESGAATAPQLVATYK